MKAIIKHKITIILLLAISLSSCGLFYNKEMSNVYAFNFTDKSGITCSYEIKYDFKYQGQFTDLDKEKLLSTFRTVSKPIVEEYELIQLIKNRDAIEAEVIEKIEYQLSLKYKKVDIKILYLTIPKDIKSFLDSKGENLDRIK